MTGPEHYREAERLIEEANHVGHEDPQRGVGIIAAAQVHATLAFAAATVTGLNDHPACDWDEWRPAVSRWRMPKGDEGSKEAGN